MSVATKMTAIADKIRNLLGISGAMGLDAMATNLGEVESEVGNQADLISQIASALEGKAGGGGAVETCTVTIKGDSSDYYPVSVGYTSVDTNGGIIYKHDTCSSSSITITCLKNSIIAVDFNAIYNDTLTSAHSDNMLFLYGKLAVFKVETNTDINNTSFHSGGMV